MFRVGIPTIGSTSWPGGINYTELMVKALRLLPESERPRTSLLFENPELLTPYESVVQRVDEVVLCGEPFREVANELTEGFRFAPDYHAELASCSAICPWPHHLMGPQFKCAYWIPDFQHKYLPQLFSPQEAAGRDAHFASYAYHAPVLVVSSNAAKEDFHKFFPDSNLDPFVLQFHSLPDEKWYIDDPEAVAKRYNLPDSFVICCNQFWQHKNHVVLFEALAQLRQRGRRIELVCTGPTEDYRNPEFFPALVSHVEKLGVRDQVHFLGMIPRQDQIQLIRRAALLVQPSLFEGWSTVVEDARVLGKSMLLSNITVHIEQEPQWGAYFEGTNPQDLAIKLGSIDLVPGPDREKEQVAKHHAYELVKAYGENLLKLLGLVASR